MVDHWGCGGATGAGERYWDCRWVTGKITCWVKAASWRVLNCAG